MIEGEPWGRDQPTSAATLVRAMMGQLQAQGTMDAFLIDAARQVRAITGFDRALIYRLTDDGSGQVIAESAIPAIERLLGLHYPASDIPVQARSLYLRNPFRIIADVASAPVAVISAGSHHTPPPPLDMSLAITRAVSPVHVEYLHNMGVAASLSISIIVDGRLWGLIACHHHRPRLPSFVMRSAAELFGAMFSLTLESRLHSAAAADDDRSRAAIEEMVDVIASDGSRLGDAAWLMAALSPFIACDGVAISNRGTIAMAGDVPDASAVATLIATLDATGTERVFTTDYLGALMLQAETYSSRAAGVLAIPIARVPRDYLMLFRKERIDERRWGGDPAAVVIRTVGDGAGGGTTRPRTSFTPFATLTSHRSAPFSPASRRIAETIRGALNDARLRLADHDADRTRQAAARQELVIGELNHRVRNILALIRGLIGQTSVDGVGTLDYVAALGGRVQALARAHDHATRQNGSPGSLTALLDDEIAAFLPTKRDRLFVAGSSVLFHPRALSTLALVIHELVTNSVKYGALSADGTVELRVTNGPAGAALLWRERRGPVVGEPTRRGFGSVIVERMIPFDLQGTARTRYLPEGFEAEFFVPASHVAGEVDILIATPLTDDGAPPKPHPLPLKGLSVLVLEDNMIVALAAEESLRLLGATKVSIAATLAEADTAIEQGGVDLVMLDIGIGDTTSAPFARRLAAAAIPFFFASGYGEKPGGNTEFPDVVIVAKPYGLHDLEIAATRCVQIGARRIMQ